MISGYSPFFLAKWLILKILDILMKLFKTEEHSDVASILNNMATVYSDLGQSQKALEILEKVYGNHEWFLFIISVLKSYLKYYRNQNENLQNRGASQCRFNFKQYGFNFFRIGPTPKSSRNSRKGLR